MIGMKLSQAKRLFFDRKVVMDAMDRATYRVLNRFGAYVRLDAKHSIRKRRGTSKAPHQPYSHAGQLRDFIIYAWDPTTRSVVIGPMLLNGRSPYGPTTVPEVLEEGGAVQRMSKKKMRTFRYAARPYMGPAFVKGQAKLPEYWANSIK